LIDANLALHKLRLGKNAFNGRLKLRSVFTRELFDLRQNLFHLVPAEGTHGKALDVAK
jgi:hypothetical protein